MLECPECGSKRLFKDGKRKLKDGSTVQRYLCRDCGYRFTDPRTRQILKVRSGISYDEGFRSPRLKLVEVKEEPEPGPQKRETTKDLKSLLFNFAWWMKKQGYAEQTIESRVKLLKVLANRGADLYDPESVKEVIAKQDWSPGRKENAVHAYTSFLNMTGGKWDPPRYRRVEKLPWIPLENEVDQLIAGCSPRIATFLQLLKETGARPGEAWNLKWKEIDYKRKVVYIQNPEKGSKPRMLTISSKLIAMFKTLQSKSESIYVFKSRPDMLLKHFAHNFRKQRRRVAAKLKNPRINQITFKTLRHFKATMEYAKTKDLIYVMEILGHKDIRNTRKYTHLVKFDSDEYISKVARSVEEACSLVEAGFEYVCDFNGAKIFRKRK